MMRYRLLPLILLISSCAPSSYEDFRHEGEACARALVKDLRQIESYDDLLTMQPVVKKHFEKLVDLMIEARQFQLKNPDLELIDIEETYSYLLKEELKRVCQMEGGKEILEKMQHEALVRLDAYERSRGSKS